jgi:hypothetical protein
LHQEGRLQSVVEMTESLRLDVSSMQGNIETHNGTIDRLLKRGVADRIERKGMIATIEEQGVKIAEQDVRINNLVSTVSDMSTELKREGATFGKNMVPVTVPNILTK